MSTIKGTPMEPILRQVLVEVAVFTSQRMTAAKQASTPTPVPASSSAEAIVQGSQAVAPASATAQ